MRLRNSIISIFLLTSLNLFSQNTENLLKIEGRASIEETPENMRIEIHVSSKDTVFSKCSDKLIDNNNLLIRDLVKNGIDKELIVTDKFDIGNEYRYEDGQQRFKGYEGSITVSMTLKYTPEKLKTIINTLRNSPNHFPYTIVFELSDNQIEKLKAKVIQDAIQDATNKANIIVESLKLKLLEIKVIKFGFITDEPSEPLILRNETVLDATEIEDASSNLLIKPAKTSVEKRIEVIWRIGK